MTPKLLPVLSISMLLVTLSLSVTGRRLGGPPLCYRPCAECMGVWESAIPLDIDAHDPYAPQRDPFKVQCGAINGKELMGFYTMSQTSFLLFMTTVLALAGCMAWKVASEEVQERQAAEDWLKREDAQAFRLREELVKLFGAPGASIRPEANLLWVVFGVIAAVTFTLLGWHNWYVLPPSPTATLLILLNLSTILMSTLMLHLGFFGRLIALYKRNFMRVEYLTKRLEDLGVGAVDQWWQARNFILNDDLALDYDIGGLAVSLTFLISISVFVGLLTQLYEYGFSAIMEPPGSYCAYACLYLTMCLVRIFTLATSTFEEQQQHIVTLQSLSSRLLNHHDSNSALGGSESSYFSNNDSGHTSMNQGFGLYPVDDAYYVGTGGPASPTDRRFLVDSPNGMDSIGDIDGWGLGLESGSGNRSSSSSMALPTLNHGDDNNSKLPGYEMTQKDMQAYSDIAYNYPGASPESRFKSETNLYGYGEEYASLYYSMTEEQRAEERERDILYEQEKERDRLRTLSQEHDNLIDLLNKHGATNLSSRRGSLDTSMRSEADNTANTTAADILNASDHSIPSTAQLKNSFDLGVIDTTTALDTTISANNSGKAKLTISADEGGEFYVPSPRANQATNNRPLGAQGLTLQIPGTAANVSSLVDATEKETPLATHNSSKTGNNISTTMNSNTNNMNNSTNTAVEKNRDRNTSSFSIFGGWSNTGNSDGDMSDHITSPTNQDNGNANNNNNSSNNIANVQKSSIMEFGKIKGLSLSRDPSMQNLASNNNSIGNPGNNKNNGNMEAGDKNFGILSYLGFSSDNTANNEKNSSMSVSDHSSLANSGANAATTTTGSNGTSPRIKGGTYVTNNSDNENTTSNGSATAIDANNLTSAINNSGNALSGLNSLSKPFLNRSISAGANIESKRQALAEMVSQIRKYDPYPCVLGIPIMPALFATSKFYIFVGFLLLGSRVMVSCLRLIL